MQWHSNAPRVLAVAHTHIVGYFFVAGMVAGLMAAGMFTAFAQFVPPRTAASYELLSCMCVAMAAVFAAAGWWVGTAPVVRAVLVATWAAVLLIAPVVFGLDEGIHSLAFGFCSVPICVLTVTVSVRAGAWMTLLCLLTMPQAASRSWRASGSQSSHRTGRSVTATGSFVDLNVMCFPGSERDLRLL